MYKLNKRPAVACMSHMLHVNGTCARLRSAACRSVTYVLSPCVHSSSFYKPSFPASSFPVASSNSPSPFSLLALSIPGFSVAIGQPGTHSHMQTLFFSPSQSSFLLFSFFSCSLHLCSTSLAFSMPLTASHSPLFISLTLSLFFSLHAAHMHCSQHPPSAPSSQAAVLMKEALLNSTNLPAKDRISELFLSSIQYITRQ